MILELNSEVLLLASPLNVEKDKYNTVDYVNNYYIGRAISANDKSHWPCAQHMYMCSLGTAYLK